LNKKEKEEQMDPSNVAASCQFYRCSQVIDWIAGATKAVNDNKAAQRQLEELQRHNRAMENHGVYLYKRKQDITRRKKNDDETLKMSRGVTTDVQLQQLANRAHFIF